MRTPAGRQAVLDRVVVVLVETSHPGNIGAAARAMKTMGLSRLRLVAPKVFPNAQASERAAGADDILHRAEVFTSLDAALADTTWAVGTSARARHLGWPEMTPESCALAVLERTASGPVAIVFGRERSGLSNAELDHCQAFVRIPAAEGFQSLNLGSAVQLVAYAVRQAALRDETPVDEDVAPARARRLASPAELEGLYAHLEQTLTEIGYYDPARPKLLMRRLRRLFARARLEHAELNILRGILRAAQARRETR